MNQEIAVRDLEASVKGKSCLRCKSAVRVAWIEGEYGLRCNCYPAVPAVGKENVVAERMWTMVQEQGIAKRQEQALTLEQIQRYISPNATQEEAYIFLRFCQAQDLNPFAREAYLIKYSASDKASIVIGVGADLKKASLHPQFGGYVLVCQGGHEGMPQGMKRSPANSSDPCPLNGLNIQASPPHDALEAFT